MAERMARKRLHKPPRGTSVKALTVFEEFADGVIIKSYFTAYNAMRQAPRPPMRV